MDNKWVIVKSAGDNWLFTVVSVSDGQGMSYGVATYWANLINEAMGKMKPPIPRMSERRSPTGEAGETG